MKIKFANDTEMELISCNEDCRMLDQSGTFRSSLSIGVVSSEDLSALKAKLTSDAISTVIIETQAGSRTYSIAEISSLSRRFTDDDITSCYITFELA